MTQTLDPSIQEATTFSHKTAPQPNVVQSITPVLISNTTRLHRHRINRAFSAAAAPRLSYSDHYLNENAPTDVLNPSVAPNCRFHSSTICLRGFGVAVNARTITVAKINLATIRSEFQDAGDQYGRASVLNLYYALVGRLRKCESQAERAGDCPDIL